MVFSILIIGIMPKTLNRKDQTKETVKRKA